MDRQSLAILVRAAQLLACVTGSIALGSGSNAYTRLMRLAETGGAISPHQLSQFPDSLRWHVVAFVAGMLGVLLLERIYHRLRPNNSFKPSPHQGSD